jgi:hypothetical protein
VGARHVSEGQVTCAAAVATSERVADVRCFGVQLVLAVIKQSIVVVTSSSSGGGGSQL